MSRPDDAGPGSRLAARLADSLPGLAVLRHYRTADLGPDLLAGLVICLVLIPSVLAYAELAGSIYEHIEARTGKPVRAMTNAELRAFMNEQGFDESTVSAVASELENCDFARFASAGAGQGEMSAALRRTRELLKAVEGARLAGDEESEEPL